MSASNSEFVRSSSNSSEDSGFTNDSQKPLVVTAEAGGLPDVKKHDGSGRSPKLLLALLAVLVTLLALLAVGMAIVVCPALRLRLWAWQSPGDKPHITVVIDGRHTRNCTLPLQKSRRPCMKRSIFITQDAPMGPMRCYDDAFNQTGGVDNCKETPFKLAAKRQGVVMPADGVYAVHAKVTFYDEVTYYVAANLRVDPADQRDCRGSLVCEDERKRRAHIWLTCTTHNRVGKGNARDFSVCDLDGVRRFREGDVVSLQVSQAFRGVSSFHKSTYMHMYRI